MILTEDLQLVVRSVDSVLVAYIAVVHSFIGRADVKNSKGMVGKQLNTFTVIKGESHQAVCS